MEPDEPHIDFHHFKNGILEECLQLPKPLFVRQDHAFRQLHYVEDYAAQLGCRAVVVENRYIDRDYMEDHSVFYSKSLHPYKNYCQRVHFFSIGAEEVNRQLASLVALGIKQGQKDFREACNEFSKASYLGFCVVKPLPGSPVGRTVMRSYPADPAEPADPAAPPDAADPAKGYLRSFDCVRSYTAHLRGIALTVRGLAFQQQDVCVSACATTAIWSALQKVCDHEDIAAVTPAQITAIASRYSLPFGRAMPSEGLSLDQMCQAIQAIGISPSLLRVEGIEAAGRHISAAKVAGAYLYSAIKSGFAPILILKKGKGYHAVAVAGMKLRHPRRPSHILPDTDDLAGDLIGLYIHDDRRGPYLRASLEAKDKEPQVVMPSGNEPDETEAWALTHILVPMHPKIRLALSALTECAIQIVAKLHGLRETVNKTRPGAITNHTIGFDCWIVRSHKYVESLFLGIPDMSEGRIAAVCEKIRFSRYLGVVRVRSAFFDPIDVLIDTTSTLKNAHCAGIVIQSASRPLTQPFGMALHRLYKCPIVS